LPKGCLQGRGRSASRVSSTERTFLPNHIRMYFTPPKPPATDAIPLGSSSRVRLSATRRARPRPAMVLVSLSPQSRRNRTLIARKRLRGAVGLGLATIAFSAVNAAKVISPPIASAQSGQLQLSLVARANASDNRLVNAVSITTNRAAVCRARVRRGNRYVNFRPVRTSSSGKGGWRWTVPEGVPSGLWYVSVFCAAPRLRASARARFAAPSTIVGPERSSSLVAPGTLRSGAGYVFDTRVVKAGNPYPVGQSTWFAFNRRPDLPYFAGTSGDALNWLSAAQRFGIPTGSSPRRAAIAVFQPGQYGTGRFGHVAYVEAITDETIQLAEAGADGSIQRRSVPWHGLNFIYDATTPPDLPTPPPSPPSPTYWAFHVIGTCASGECGLNARTAPSVDAQSVAILVDGTEVDIVCQTVGSLITGPSGTSSDVWDKLTNGLFIADYFVDTPVRGYTPSIPRC
jgi:surface antigen